MTGTAAIDRYAAAFDTFSGNGAGDVPAWLVEIRRAGMSRFAEVGFPTTKEENWRFTSVRRIAERDFVLPGAGGAVSGETVMGFVYDPAAPRIVFVDGRYAPEHSSLAGLPAGVTVTGLAEAVRTHPELVRAHLGQAVPVGQSGFSALNAAFTHEGAFVHLGAGSDLGGVVEILYLVTGGEQGKMIHPRNLVVVEDGASGGVVETYAGLPGGGSFTNAVTELVVGNGARFECTRVQLEPENGFHVAATQSTQGRDSHVVMTVVPFGGALTRHDVRMVLAGEGADGTLNGLYVMRDAQHVDHNTTIEHASPNGNSREYFNGVLDGESRAVFNGRIIVRPGAQKTDSKQTNNNLLLSEDARADSQPQLEIYADDVRCTHGATLGPLDANAAFYLRSRGLDERTARNLLTYGYGVEILETVGQAAVRERLDGLLRARLSGDRTEG